MVHNTPGSKSFDCTYVMELDGFVEAAQYNKESIGELFFAFFEFMSEQFDYRTQVQ